MVPNERLMRQICCGSPTNRKGCDFGYVLAADSCEVTAAVDACAVTSAITALAVPNPGRGKPTKMSLVQGRLVPE